MAFLAYKNKHRQLEDLLQADFGHVPERFLLSVRTKSITKNFVYWKFCWLFLFVVCFNSFFHLEPLCQCTLQFLFGNCLFLCFHSSVKWTFLVGKGLLCFYDKQNNTWLFVDMKFLFLVQLYISLVCCTHSWAIELNTWREIPYLRTPMCYSLLINRISVSHYWVWARNPHF